MPHPSETDLRALFAGELATADAGLVSVHLDGCADCREVADRLTEVPRDLWAALVVAADRSVVPARPVTITIPGHEDLRELGRGGCGVVYRATESTTGRQVALKILRAGPLASPAEHEWFRAEARAAARLNHPNVVTVHVVGEACELPYYAMEYLPAGSLADLLDGTPLPSRRAAALVEKVAEAIAFAHGRGVIHRDLKPGNILLAGPPGGPDVPKVSDFGMAKHHDAGLLATPTQAVLGTPSYMAPEQAFGRSRDAAPTMDIYSLGAVLYELLTGRPPFRGASPYETLLQVRDEEPIPPRRLNPGIPKDLETVCLKCLEKPPGRRYPTAGALAADLRAFLEGRAVVARPVGWQGHLARWVRRNPAVAVLGGVSFGLLAAGLLTSTILWRRAEARGAEARAWAGEAERRQASARQALRLYAQSADKVFRYPYLISREERDALVRAIGVHERLMLESTGDPDEDDQSARTMLELAGGLNNIGELETAARICRGAIEKLRQLCEANPSRHEIRNHYTDGCSSLGGILNAIGDKEGSFQYYKEAVRAGELLVARHPNLDHYRGCLAIYRCRMAQAHVDRGNPDAAECLFLLSLEENRRLVGRYPEDPFRYTYFNDASVLFGNFVLLHRKDIDRYRELGRERMELSDKARGQPNWPLIARNIVHTDAVAILDKVGRHVEADQVLEHAIKTWTDMLALKPPPLEARLTLTSFIELDAERRRQTDPAGARERYRRKISLLEPSGTQPIHQQDVLELAKFLTHCPDPTIRDPARALALLRRFPSADTLHHYRLGMCHDQLGEYRDARSEFEQFLNENRQPSSDIHSLAARVFLAKSLARLGEKPRAEAELQRAEEAIQKAHPNDPFILAALDEAKALLKSRR